MIESRKDLYEKARKIYNLQVEIKEKELYKSKNADQKWLDNMIKRGTHADKISAL